MLVQTDLLSHRTFAGPSIGIPNDRNLIRKALSASVAALSATNSLPNVDPSTVVCRFEYQMIGARLRKIR